VYSGGDHETASPLSCYYVHKFHNCFAYISIYQNSNGKYGHECHACVCVTLCGGVRVGNLFVAQTLDESVLELWK